jgi:hypothetical protein
VAHSSITVRGNVTVSVRGNVYINSEFAFAQCLRKATAGLIACVLRLGSPSPTLH